MIFYLKFVRIHQTPPFETPRLKELYDLNILDTGKEERFDRFVKLIADIFSVPITLISLVDTNRQWFKSCLGLTVNETSRQVSFCAHALMEKELLVIPDATKDKRFADNPLVVGDPHIAFYAGAVLRGPTGQPLGTICIIDKKPREFSEKEKNRLIQFAHLVEHELLYSHHLKSIRNKVEEALYFDPLTKLPNKRLLCERLKQAIDFIQDNQQIFVIALKINRLKDLENAYGVATANFILQEVTKRLQEITHEDCTIARLDEESFITFIMLNPRDATILTYIQNILNLFANPFVYKNKQHNLSCNLGVSIHPVDSKNIDELIEHAIYTMKIQPIEASSHYRFYSDDATQKFSQAYTLEMHLRDAIENEKLELHYQPIIDIFTSHIIGADVSCHWIDNQLGPIPSQTFIPLAEQSDLIIPLNEWMLKKACLQYVSWQQEQCRPFTLNVNIFRKSLMQPNFTKEIGHLLATTHMNPKYLEFVIAELNLWQIETILSKLHILSESGIRFTLNNFGTGQSSLTCIQYLPLSALRIHTSLISGIVDNKKSAAIVRAIIALTKTLNLVSIAQGVESSEQLTYLRAYQCDAMQGKLFHPPLPAKQFNELLVKDERLII